MLIREGSVRLLSEFGQPIAQARDLIVLCATTLCGAIPQGTVTVSTAYVDPDYLLDQARWCHAEQLADRMAAEAMVECTFHRRAQLFHLRPHTADLFAKFFDGIESAASRHANPFYATQSHFSLVMHLLSELISSANEHAPGVHAIPTAGGLDRRAKYAPVRSELLRVERALRDDLRRRWTVREMADITHLSPRHLSRVFIDSLGRTPASYLAVLRAKWMSQLLRESNMSIVEAGRAVGWHSRSNARQSFKAAVGMTPSEYREQFGGQDTDVWHRDTDEVTVIHS